MYIKREIRDFIERMEELKFPDKWETFTKKQKEQNNLIIKNKNDYYCTNCKNTFESTIKVNQCCKCKHCKNTYLIKSNKLGYYTMKSDLILLQKFEDKYILRDFELLSTYSQTKMTHNIVEYSRHILNNDFKEQYNIVNDNLNINMGIHINHCSSGLKWRILKSHYYYLEGKGKLYHYNLKQLFKDTDYKYSQLWILADKVKTINIMSILNNFNANIEFLIKLKLYNLANNNYTQFEKRKCSFERRYGIKKELLPFVQKHDLNYYELKALQTIKKPKIKLIRWASDLNYYDEITEFMDLEKAYKFGINKENEAEYKDYLEICKKLNYDMKNKQILFPKNIIEAHDKVVALYELQKNKKINNLIKKRGKELSKNEFVIKDYTIIAAKSLTDLNQESKNQNNCVKTYAKDYADGKLDLYFMRNKNELDKSLVTIEVRNKQIKQSRIKNNEQVPKDLMKILKKWELKVLNK